MKNYVFQGATTDGKGGGRASHCWTSEGREEVEKKCGRNWHLILVAKFEPCLQTFRRSEVIPPPTHQIILYKCSLLTKHQRGYRQPQTSFLPVSPTRLVSCKSYVLWEMFQDKVLQEYLTNIDSIAKTRKFSECRTLIKTTRQESDQNIERKSLKRHLLDISQSQELGIRHKFTLY